MRFLRKIIITFFVFILSLGISFASSNFISKLNIFENYLKNQKVNIEKLIIKYDIKGSKKLKSSIKEIDELINIIKKIKHKKIGEDYEEVILNTIKDKVKFLNYKTKKYLKKEVYKYEKSLKKERLYYQNVSYKLEKSLDKLIKNLYKLKLEKNKKLSEKELKLTDNLIKLKKESSNLKNFTKVNFKSKENMKNVFLNILKNIKKELNNLKYNL